MLSSVFAFPVASAAGAAPGSGPCPALGPVLGALDQASVMGQDLVLRQMKRELQGHQHWEFKGNQFSSIQPELLFQFLQWNEGNQER